MNKFDLGLDYKRVIEIICYHDIVEIGLKQDYSAERAAVDQDYKNEKEEFETANVVQLCKILGEKLRKRSSEYSEAQSREAKFAKLVDKIEPFVHLSERGGIALAGISIQNMEKFIGEFPELLPLIEEMKGEFAQSQNTAQVVGEGKRTSASPQKAGAPLQKERV